MKRRKAIIATFKWDDDAWVCRVPGLDLKRIYVMSKEVALRRAAAWMSTLATEKRPIRLNIYRRPAFLKRPGIEEERFYPRSADPRRSRG